MKDTKKLLREITKLTNEIDKLLKSNTPRAKKLLKSIAGKAREQGVIIADNLTDAELGEVIRKADKTTKQAIIYAVQNQLPNLKTLHKGKKNIKLDKAIATKKLNYAIAPDKVQVAKSQADLFLEKRYRGAKAKLKKEADKKLKEEHPDLWNLLNQEKIYAAEEKKRLRDLKKAEQKRIRNLEKKNKKDLAAKEKEKQKERLRLEKEAEATRQKELHEKRVDAILGLKKSFQEYLNDFAKMAGMNETTLASLVNKDLTSDLQKSRDFNLAAQLLNAKYGINPDIFLEASGQNMSKKNMLKGLDPEKFKTTDDTIKFLEALRLVDPYQARHKELTDYFKKLDKKAEEAEQLYVLPKGKLIGLDLQFKSGITAEELTNLKDTLEVFKMVADSPEKLSEDVMNQGGMMMSVYAKLKIECIQLMAKTDAIIAVTMTKQGAESGDSKFWGFATYKSNEATDEGVFVKKGFVVDGKGIHTRLETFLTSINDIINSSETKDEVLIKYGNDIAEYASGLKDTYNVYKGFYQTGDLGRVDDKGEIKFNAEAFDKIAKIGERYQNYLIETQATLQALRSYCDKAIKFAKDEVSRFLRKMK